MVNLLTTMMRGGSDGGLGPSPTQTAVRTATTEPGGCFVGQQNPNEAPRLPSGCRPQKLTRSRK